jgi:hypothetical protein
MVPRIQLDLCHLACYLGLAGRISYVVFNRGCDEGYSSCSSKCFFA